MKSFRWAIFVSGEGSNLQNVLDLEKNEWTCQSVALVVADRPCRAIERAAGKSHKILNFKGHYTQELLELLSVHQIDGILLLGFMRILSGSFLKEWKKEILNLHPSLLPKYPGLQAVEQALKAEDEFLGVTLHRVVEEVDAGTIVRQISFPIDRNFNLSVILEKVHHFERVLVRDYLNVLERELKLS